MCFGTIQCSFFGAELGTKVIDRSCRSIWAVLLGNAGAGLANSLWTSYASLRKDSETLGNQGMTDTHHEFDLAAESQNQKNGPKTEELDSGDYFHAPERHWLVRFSVVIFGIGLLAGASATTAASNTWIAFDTSVMCVTLSAGCVLIFFGVLWWITLRELKSHSKARAALKRYRVTSLYFWCGLVIPVVIISVATYVLIYHKEPL